MALMKNDPSTPLTVVRNVPFLLVADCHGDARHDSLLGIDDASAKIGCALLSVDGGGHCDQHDDRCNGNPSH